MLARLCLLGALLLAVPLFGETPTKFEQIAKQADAAQASDHLNEAIDLYRQGLRINPSWSEGWWSLGSVLYDQDRFPEAEKAFRRFVVASPKPGPGYAFLALCEYETREYDNSLRHMRVWASKGWSGTAELIDVGAFHFALLLTREGKFVEALYLLAGQAEKGHSGPTLTEAIGLASLGIRSVPEDYPPEKHEMVWLAGKAAFYAAVHPHEFDRADEYAGRLKTHYDAEPNVHYFLGTLLKYEGKDEDAGREFKRELHISPKHAAAMTELARVDLDGNNVDEGISLARQACSLEPQNSEAHRVYAGLLGKSQKFEESARELEIAKKLAPDSAPVRFQLAAAYRKLNRRGDADRETAAFNMLKDKQNVMASPAEKLRKNPELLK